MADYIVHKAVERSALSAKTTQALEANEEWIITPKYDGCHAVFLFDDGKHVGTLSRTGEPVRSMPHIVTALLDTYPLAAGRIAICGEAWSPGLEFNEISGLFRRHTPSPQLGFVPFDRTGAELLFNLLANRYQRRATVVTTNLAFSEWSRVFGDEKLTAALLDRIAENAQVVLTGGPSFRTRRPAPNATAGG